MAITKEIPLTKPVTIGGQECNVLILTETTSEHVLDAQEESEKLVMTPDGPALVSSPSRMGVNVLRRQVVRIGEINGPVDLTILKRLSPLDLERVQKAAEEMDALAAKTATAILKRIEQRGRTDERDG